MERTSEELVAAPTLRIMGGLNYAQFGDWVHAGGVDVRAEADHAYGTDYIFMDRGGLEKRDELGGVVGGVNSTACG